jgi:hypothetical protein
MYNNKDEGELNFSKQKSEYAPGRMLSPVHAVRRACA